MISNLIDRGNLMSKEMIHFYDLRTTIPVPTTRYVSNSELAIDGRDERLRNILKGSSVKGMTTSGDSA